jgi:stress response protein YsnF
MNPSMPGDSASPAGETVVIPVLGEQAQVHAVREHTGTVRVRKVVHEACEPVGAPGYREVVETVRVAVNRVVPAVRAPWQEGGALVVPVYEERLVHQLVLLEEIHVRRRREPLHTDAVVRREEAIVERLDPQTRQWIREAT